jgi:hypothetical protein
MTNLDNRSVGYLHDPEYNHFLLFPLSWYCVKKHVNITKYIFMPVFLLFLLLSFLLQEGTRNRCKLLEWMLT